MPKGIEHLQSRDVAARIGRFLRSEELEEMTAGISRAEAYRSIAARVRHEVENLRDGTQSQLRRQSRAQTLEAPSGAAASTH